MKIMMEILILGIFLNLSAGIIAAIIPEFNYASNIDTNSDMMGLKHNDTYADGLVDVKKEINAQGNAEDKSDFTSSLLDAIGLGVIKRWLNWLDTSMFYIVHIMDAMFGQKLIRVVAGVQDRTLYNLFFGPVGVFRIMITLGYILTAMSLWTGKSVKAE